MKRDRIDYLIVRNDESFLGGPIKWFTDLPATNNYPVTAIFPADEEMTLISHGAPAPGEPGSCPMGCPGREEAVVFELLSFRSLHQPL